ncbi:hypothetical protein [Methanobrevibacter sp. DSM 116169]|uniref:hypothetical protein n=1 Tax=Methanobrevibacter sp. DSM 116169 TaxID=3242727 RepID=UPI0038FCD3AA
MISKTLRYKIFKDLKHEIRNKTSIHLKLLSDDLNNKDIKDNEYIIKQVEYLDIKKIENEFQYLYIDQSQDITKLIICEIFQ